MGLVKDANFLCWLRLCWLSLLLIIGLRIRLVHGLVSVRLLLADCRISGVQGESRLRVFAVLVLPPCRLRRRGEAGWRGLFSHGARRVASHDVDWLCVRAARVHALVGWLVLGRGCWGCVGLLLLLPDPRFIRCAVLVW